MLVPNGCARFWGGGIVLTDVFKTQFCAVIFVLWTSLFGAVSSEAKPQLKITVVSAGEVRIRADSLPPGREWSFRNAYAGVLGLAERIEQFRAFEMNGADARAKK